MLHHAPICLQDTVDLEHLFPCNGGVTAAAAAAAERDTDQEDSYQGDICQGEAGREDTVQE